MHACRPFFELGHLRQSNFVLSPFMQSFLEVGYFVRTSMQMIAVEFSSQSN